MERPLTDPQSRPTPAKGDESGGISDAGRSGGCIFTLVDSVGSVLKEPTEEDIQARLQGNVFFWLDLHAPPSGDIAMLGEVFGFHPLALEDSAEFGQRPKIEPYDGHRVSGRLRRDA